MPLPALSLAVVGADYPNKGKSPTRRFEIALCKPGDSVELAQEPNNPADPRAVAVYSERGVMMGYLTAERCGRIGQVIRQGRQVHAIFQRATRYGAVIRVAFDGERPTLPDEQPNDFPDEAAPWLDETYLEDGWPEQ